MGHKAKLMTTVLKYRILFLVLWAGISTGITAQNEAGKMLVKEYDFKRVDEVVIQNKYGNISVESWTNNSIKIITTVKLKRGNSKKILDKVKFDFIESTNYLSVTTHINTQKKRGLGNLLDKINPANFKESDLDISYRVFVPEDTELSLTNSFGDIIIEDCTGRLQTKTEHGDVRISGTPEYVDLSLTYGKLRVFELSKGHIDLKNGGCSIHQSDNLRITASGSQIDLGTVNTLYLKSSKDQAIIKVIKSISGEIEYSKVILENLEHTGNLLLNQAELHINKMLNNRPSLELDQTSSDVLINIGGTSFELHAFLTGGTLRIPKTIQGLNANTLSSRNKKRRVNGFYGKAPYGRLDITGKKGFILLQTN